MKRSEMVNHIKRYVNNNHKSEWNDIDSHTFLLYLEDAGLLPPFSEKYSYIMLDDGQMIYSNNSWEPEDEPKS